MPLSNNGKIAAAAGLGFFILLVIIIIYYYYSSSSSALVTTPTTPASTPTTPATSPSTPPTTSPSGTLRYVGCYTDQPTARAIPGNSAQATLSQCQAAAQAAGSPYFGLQFGNPTTGYGQCFSGTSATTLANAQQYGAAASCSPVTDSNTLALLSGAYMGGVNSNAVYAT